MDPIIDFYDFVWKEGVQAHGACINDELRKDFAKGGNAFTTMKRLIVKKFPTEADARKAFSKHGIQKR